MTIRVISSPDHDLLQKGRDSCPPRVGDTSLYEDSRARHAEFAIELRERCHYERCDGLNVGVFKNNQRSLTAQFQANPLERLCAFFGDLPTYLGAAGIVDNIDVSGFDQQRRTLVSILREDVHHSLRQTPCPPPPFPYESISQPRLPADINTPI